MYGRICSRLTARQAAQLRTTVLPGNWRYRIPCEYGIGYARLTPTPARDFPVQGLVVAGDRSELTLPTVINFVLALKPRPDSSFDFRFDLPRRRPTGPWNLASEVTQALATLGTTVTLIFPTLTHPVQVTLPAASSPSLVSATETLCHIGPALWRRPQVELRTEWQCIIERGRYEPTSGWGSLIHQITYLLELSARQRSFEQIRRDRRRITEYWAYTLGQ